MLCPFTEKCGRCTETSVLIVGEGNFSFACHYANVAHGAIVQATSLDQEKKIFADGVAKSNVEFLNSLANFSVRHGIDATKLTDHYDNTKSFCTIIFNFPHVGGKSNIKECRKLLYHFFDSASQLLCVGGKIVVALCKGQGGTPADLRQRIYKNSWMVSSQASKAGCYLANVSPFNESSVNYIQAGYRGLLQKQFLTGGGLVHVFKKGCRFDSIKSLHVEVLSNHSLRPHVKIYGAVAALILSNMKNLFPQIVWTKFAFPSKEGGIIWNPHMDDISTTLSKRQSYDLIEWYNFNSHTKFLPFLHPISHSLLFSFPVSVSEYDAVKSNILQGIVGSMLRNLQYTIVECSCNSKLASMCNCLFVQSQIVTRLLYTKQVEEYNSNIVPYFISDLQESFWKNQTPDICVSHNDPDHEDVISHQACDPNCYELNDLERTFFGLVNDSGIYRNSSTIVTKVIVEGLCIASVLEVGNKMGLIIHSNEFLYTVFGVKDLRYLWGEDLCFQNHLLTIMCNASESQEIKVHKKQHSTMVKYPLCYRHDLCFWLDVEHTQNDLFSTIEAVCGQLIHSIRLLKVLKHKESSCVSYCYRMIYCRVDGPLSHEETVDIQNVLRHTLLEKGFQLR